MSQPSTALSVTPSNKFWLLDLTCCNHMTPHVSYFSHKTPLTPNHVIYTVDSSHMSVSHIGIVFSLNITFFSVLAQEKIPLKFYQAIAARAPTLTIPDIYLVPKFSLNLFSVRQLFELNLDLIFSNRGVDVQDPLAGKLLGTGHKIGRLFELHNLQIPSHLVSSFVATTTLSPDLRHFHLGYASLSRLQLLAFRGHLGYVSF